MKKILFCAFSLFLLTGCGVQDKFKASVDDLKDAKNNLDQKVQDVKDAKAEVDAAMNQVGDATDSVTNVFNSEDSK